MERIWPLVRAERLHPLPMPSVADRMLGELAIATRSDPNNRTNARLTTVPNPAVDVTA